MVSPVALRYFVPLKSRRLCELEAKGSISAQLNEDEL